MSGDAPLRSRSLPVAFAGAAVVLAGLEVLRLGGALPDGVRAAAALVAVVRLGWFGAVVGAVLLPLEVVLRRLEPRRRRIVRGLLIAGVAGVGAALVLGGGAARDGGAAAAGSFAVLSAAGGGLLALGFRSRWRGPALLGLVVVALVLAWLDPRGLRGTYPAFDLFLLGGALGLLATAGVALLDRRPAALSAATVLLAVGLIAAAFLEDPAGRAALLPASPRFQTLDRWWTGLGLFVPEAADGEVLEVAPESLFDPPVDPEAARRQWRERVGARAPTSVLWVTIDALRPEVTGLRGGTATPSLDALAARSFAFSTAFSQAPGTGVSVESMFTSRHPGRTSVSRAWAAGGEIERFESLAGILGAAGWRTFFVSGMDVETLGKPQFRLLGNGFSVVEGSRGPTDAAETAARAIARLPEGPGERFFGWVHLFDPHDPYVVRGEVENPRSPRQRWESEVRYADRGLQQILSALDARGLRETTLVVVHADHAEAFGEHGRFYHASSYYDTQIHVPLVLHVPALPAARIDRPVGNVDLAPTILELLGRDVPRFMQGVSLLPVLLQPELPWPRATFAETLIIEDGLGWTRDRIRMATDGRWKLIEHLSDRTTLLFDRVDDPLERHDRAAEHPEEVARLRGWLRALDLRCDARDAGLGGRAPEARGWEAYRERLGDADPRVRSAALREIVAARRPDLVRMLEQHLGELPDASAHQVLVLLDTVLLPSGHAPEGLPPLPERAGALRFRLLERLAHDPALRARPVPLPMPPVAGMERDALVELRAARGEIEAREELLRREPSSRAEWDSLAPALALGGSEVGAEVIARGLLAPSPPEGSLLRGLRVLATGDSPWFTAVVTRHWPSTKPKVEPLRYQEIIDLAVGLRHRGAHAALLALLPEAGPRGQERLLARLAAVDPGFTADGVRELVAAWARGREAADAATRREQLEAARARVPAGVVVEALDRELALVGAALDPARIEELEVRVEGVAAGPDARRSGPPRLTLRCEGATPIPLGGGGLEGLVLTWKGPGGVREAGIAWLERAALRAGAPARARVPLDHPREPGRWRLSVDLGGRELVSEAAPVEYVVPPADAWSGPAVARVLASWGGSLRRLPDGAGLEVVTGGKVVTRLPERTLAAGDVGLALEVTVHAPEGAPYTPVLRCGLESTAAMGAVAPGRRVRIEGRVTVPAAGVHVLDVVWPDLPALVTIHRVEVLP